MLATLSELIKEGKLLGPYKPGTLEVKNFITYFLVEKNGRVDKNGRQMYRLIGDGSRETLISKKQKLKLENWLAAQPPARLLRMASMEGGLKAILAIAKNELGIKTNLNDHINKDVGIRRGPLHL